MSLSKYFLVASLSLLLFSFWGCSSSSTKSGEVAAAMTTKGDDIQLRPYQVKTLNNGLKIYFIKDDSLPRVSLNLLVKSGLLQESTAGLNYITAQLLEEGTQSKTSLQIAEALGALGTGLNVSPGADYTTIASDSLSTSSQQLLDIFSEIIQKPAFREVEIERLRSQILAEILRKKDNPSAVTDDYFDEVLFAGTPYQKDIMGSAESVSKIKKKDIIQHYLTWYRPNNALLAIVGSFDAQFEEKVSTLFANWGSRVLPLKEVIAKNAVVNSSTQAETHAYLKKSLAQTQIRMGLVGITRSNPDFLTLRLANEILGGSFASRLMQRVRDDLGLTYSIYSAVDARQFPGALSISTFTKNETAVQTIVETKKVLEAYLQEGPTSRELRAAQNQLKGQFPRAIETSDRYAFNLMLLDFYGVPFSYLTDFNKNIEKMTISDVQKVLQKYYKPSEIKTVIYGDLQIEPQLAQLKADVQKL